MSGWVACAGEPDEAQRNPDPARDGEVAYNAAAVQACGSLEDAPAETTAATSTSRPRVVEGDEPDSPDEPSPDPWAGSADVGMTEDAASWEPEWDAGGGWDSGGWDSGGWEPTPDVGADTAADVSPDVDECSDAGDAGNAACDDAGSTDAWDAADADAGGLDGGASDAGDSDSGASDAGADAPDGADAGADAGGGEGDADGAAPKCVPVAGAVASSSESYATFVENDFVATRNDALATFSLDVDTASYSLARRNLNACTAPAPGSVRIEEFLNAFDYAYPNADGCEAPFSVYTEAGPSPFGGPRGMLHIGIQADKAGIEQRQPANLVFLVDVSGSMLEELPLVRDTLTALLDQLDGDDTLAIVTYAGRDRVLLEPSPVRDRAAIERAIGGLSAGGSTAGAAGMRTAYDLARGALRSGGINRVILCTDGDFNVGLSGDELVPFVEAQRDLGVALTVLGYGYGNLRDDFLEEITNVGDGNYTYIATSDDARRVATRDLMSTLQIVASDVKIQVEVNADVVSRHRIIGYDNRVLEHWQFDDDTVDAADVGAGQGVTALMELEFTTDPRTLPDTTVLAEVRIRFKYPGESSSVLLRRQILARDVRAALADTSDMYRWSLAVAEFAEVLRDSRHVSAPDLDAVLAIAEPIASDPDREEFVDLVRRARELIRPGL